MGRTAALASLDAAGAAQLLTDNDLDTLQGLFVQCGVTGSTLCSAGGVAELGMAYHDRHGGSGPMPLPWRRLLRVIEQARAQGVEQGEDSSRSRAPQRATMHGGRRGSRHASSSAHAWGNGALLALVLVGLLVVGLFAHASSIVPTSMLQREWGNFARKSSPVHLGRSNAPGAFSHGSRGGR